MVDVRPWKDDIGIWVDCESPPIFLVSLRLMSGELMVRSMVHQ